MAGAEDVLMRMVERGVLRVGESGDIWRLARLSRTGRVIPCTPYRADEARLDGYRSVRVQIEGRSYAARAHRLVWRVHRGAIPMGVEINHRDGVRDHNALSNLELASKGENLQHSYDQLARPRAAGGRNGRAKLTRQKAERIRRRAADGEAGRALAREFGVAHTVVQRIIAGRYWRDEMPERVDAGPG